MTRITTAGHQQTPTLPPDTRPIVDPDDPRSIIPGFAVRDDGTVFYYSARWKKWKALKPKTGPGGFIRVWVKIGDRVRRAGGCPPGLESIRRPLPSGPRAASLPQHRPRRQPPREPALGPDRFVEGRSDDVWFAAAAAVRRSASSTPC